MTPEEKYRYIVDIVFKMIPPEITGRRKINTKANIRTYVKRKLGLKQGDGLCVVHLSIRNKVDDLILDLNM